MREWRAERIALLDVETTGLDPLVDRVVEVALIILDGVGSVIEEVDWLVNPGRPIPPEATAIHKITDEDVAGEGTWQEVGCELGAQLEMHEVTICAAYNRRFDRAMIGAEYLRTAATLPMPRWLYAEAPWIDPLVWARVAYPNARGKGKMKLEAVAERLGVPQGPAHSAWGDVITLGHVLKSLASLGNSRGPLMPIDLDELLARQAMHAAAQDLDYREYRLRKLLEAPRPEPATDPPRAPNQPSPASAPVEVAATA